MRDSICWPSAKPGGHRYKPFGTFDRTDDVHRRVGSFRPYDLPGNAVNR